MTTAPVIITTWKFGLAASRRGWELLSSGATAIDAVEAAANVVELDPDISSVGYGGLPNTAGVVELDAAIMDGATHAAGAVGALQHIKTPISVARRVMECTQHTMLVGANALQFALRQGFKEEELLTDAACERWRQWRLQQIEPEAAHFDSRPPQGVAQPPSRELALTPDDHDTIGLCAMDVYGNLAAGCTTSGMAWKVPGRVGDSPIIGSGLYVDNAVGAAAGTGHGDEMMRACVSFLTVQAMERGMTPQEACIYSLRYLMRKRPPELHNQYSAAIIAVRNDGMVGAAATRSGFKSPDRLWQWATAGETSTLHEGPYVTESELFETMN